MSDLENKIKELKEELEATQKLYCEKVIDNAECAENCAHFAVENNELKQKLKSIYNIVDSEEFLFTDINKLKIILIDKIYPKNDNAEKSVTVEGEQN